MAKKKVKKIPDGITEQTKVWMNKILSNIPDDYQGHFVVDFGRILIIRSKKCPASMVLKWKSGYRDTVYLEHLVVPKKNRRNGMGTEMLDIAVKLCKVCKRSFIDIHGILSEKQKAWLEKKGFRDMEMMYTNDELTWLDFCFDTWWDKLSDEVLYSLNVNDYGTSHRTAEV